MPSQRPEVAWYDYILRFGACAFIAKIIFETTVILETVRVS